MISCVVLDDRVTELFMTTHTRVFLDPAWNLVRPSSWCWTIHFETKKQSQKSEKLSFVHFIVRWSWITLLSADCCLPQ